MLLQGLVLMVVGMGVVYAFLYLMVLIMRLISLVVPRFNHLLPDAPAPSPPRPDPRAAADGDVPVAIAVAAAAARRPR